MKAALYARISTANHGQDVTMQTRELYQYCERRGWDVGGEYVDIGISGTKEKRPELDRLMADGHKRRFDAVVVWKFDRFARSVSHLLRALDTFKALGIEFISLSEQLDTTTPAGKMVFTVLGAVAELERSLIVERVRAGLRHAKAKGTRLGRPRVYAVCRSFRSLGRDGTGRIAARVARQETLLPGRGGFTGMDPDQTRGGIHFHYAADNREVDQMDDVEDGLFVGHFGSGEFLVICSGCFGRVF